MSGSKTPIAVRRKRWWIASVGVAAVLLMAAVLGVYWPGGFVVLGWLDLPGLFGAAAMGMLALAWWLWFRAVDHPLGKRMRAPTAEQRNQWWIALVALAALLIMVTVLGVWRPGTLVVLGWPVLLGTVALGLLAVACWLALRDFVVRLFFVSVLVVLAFSWAVLGAWLASWFNDDGKVARYWSPDGGKVLLVYPETHLAAPNPITELRLRSGEREWDLGCVNTEVDSVDEVEWLGPGRLRVHLNRHGPVDIVLYRSTGHPSNKVSEGC
jgi:hypothetical protein